MKHFCLVAAIAAFSCSALAGTMAPPEPTLSARVGEYSLVYQAPAPAPSKGMPVTLGGLYDFKTNEPIAAVTTVLSSRPIKLGPIKLVNLSFEVLGFAGSTIGPNSALVFGTGAGFSCVMPGRFEARAGLAVISAAGAKKDLAGYAEITYMLLKF